MSRATTPTKSRALHGKKRNKKWKRHPDDWYVEPMWVNERLFQVEQFEGKVWDPACGLGRIVTAARAAGHEAVGTDIVDRGFKGWKAPRDFLDMESVTANIACNPPFRLAEAFVQQALARVERKVVMLLPAVWVQGQTRSRWLAKSPLRRVWFLAPRPSMPPGPVFLSGESVGQGIQDFAWFVWLKGYDGHPEIRWLRRDDGITSAHMGPEQRDRNRIKTSGRLQTPEKLPLFTQLKAVTRDSKPEQEARYGD